MNKSLPEALMEALRRATRQVIDITPPAHNGKTGADAYRHGRSRIKSDLHKVLAPIRLKGKRVIAVVFGNQLKKPVVIRTTEKHPDVASLYRQHRRVRGVGVGGHAKSLGDNKYYVDTRKFTALLRQKEANVGKLAAGWNPAASGLDIPVQNWIARHGMGSGQIQLSLMPPNMSGTVVNLAPGLAPNVRAELARRIPYALVYAAAGMRRNVEFMTLKNAQRMGIKTRAIAGALFA